MKLAKSMKLSLCSRFGWLFGMPLLILLISVSAIGYGTSWTELPPPVVVGVPAMEVATATERPVAPAKAEETIVDEAKWYRGNLHTHSLWSDGNDFPEMIARWYADNGYHFLALSDHNILSRNEKWMNLEQIEKRGGEECMEKYKAAFAEGWVKTREVDGKTQVRLCPLNEFRELFESPGEFLMIEGEEISDSLNGTPIHLNATNLEELLRPTGGATVSEVIDANLRAAADQAEKTGRQILVHLNHPNFGWAITAEDLAKVTRERFFEVYNGHPSVNHLGDADHPSVERIWDIVNTLRVDKLEAPLLYGLATDDSHNYHSEKGSRPGRGWVMVKSEALDADELIKAMYRGDFYSSSGVELSKVEFDSEAGTWSIEIVAEEGVTYETRFIGTRRGYNDESKPRLDNAGQPTSATREYSKEIGEVLATNTTTSPGYRLTGDELFVRAVITSSKDHPDPSFDGQTEQAWTQPFRGKSADD